MSSRKNTDKNTATHKFLTRVPTFAPGDSVAHARRVIEQHHDWDSVEYIYLLDKDKHPVGALSVKELMRAPLEVELKTIAQAKVFTVKEHTRPERVAILAIHHGIVSVPVVDKNGAFLGVIDTPEIMETLQHAGIDDAIRYSGIHLEHRGLLDVLHGRVAFLIKRRLPWLIVGLVGALIVSLFVGQFERYLREVIELAFFTPAIVYMGAAVGNQTQALFLRSITIGEVRVHKFLIKEFLVDTVIGLVVGLLSYLAIVIFLKSSVVALIVALAMFLTILVAGLVAILMTVLLTRYKKQDPALGAGPFATIIQDFVSLAVYFLVASFILSRFGVR